MYYLTKGLLLKQLNEQTFVVEDVFGNTIPPFTSTQDTIDEDLENLVNVKRLVPFSHTFDSSDLTSFSWSDVEYYYVVHIEYSLERYLMTAEELDSYHAFSKYLPMEYFDFGNGDGTKEEMEDADKRFRLLVENDDVPFNDKFLNRWLIVNEINRICSDIASLIIRAIRAFINLLGIQRRCIINNSVAMEQLNCQEIRHSGAESHKASTAATTSAISLCTSLDLSSKLVHYLNSISVDQPKFKPASGKHFSDLKSMQSKNIPNNSCLKIKEILDRIDGLGELIQFRHDIVHSTSAIELEKVYIGKGTPEVNGLPLYYSSQPWRDCQINGQPVRYLGRSYFTGDKTDIESRIYSWILSVISAHVEVGKSINNYLKNNA